jgi:hypothetical protein
LVPVKALTATSRVVLITALIGAVLGALPGRSGAATSDVFVFTPLADAFVDSTNPTTTYGTKTFLNVDGSPPKQAFMRFDLANIAGRTVTGVHLRMYVTTNASSEGGRVFPVADTSWEESITWDTRPSFDPTKPPLADFGAVGTTNTWYQVDLPLTTVTGDGPLSFAIDSTSSDAVRWSSREGTFVPQLIVEVLAVSGLVIDGVMTVAGPTIGSSDPTEFAINRRIAVTATGRLLALHGRHANGIQLTWRDPGGGWQTTTTGSVTDGRLNTDTGTGDWTTSVVLGRDMNGDEHAWVVWAIISGTAVRPVEMRRLSDLDSVNGPTIGPRVTVEPSGLGNVKVDMAFETALDGSLRGAISWLQHSSGTTWARVVTWFTDLDTDTPTFHDKSTLFSGTDSLRAGTLVPSAGGMRLVSRSGSGPMKIWGHDRDAPLSTWWSGASTFNIFNGSYPGAVSLSSGEVLAAAETNFTTHVVRVARFSASGSTVTTDLILTGYTQPSLATDGTDAWLVMVRSSDGYVVSRQFSEGSGWSSSDLVEIGSEGGGNYEWPNLVRETDGRLRLIVRGPSGGSSRSAVLSYQRVL